MKRTPVKRRNVKRHKTEWARAYGSVERVEWVKGLRCAGCGLRNNSENAHTVNGGRGRKANYDTIAPLCGDMPWLSRDGCHTKYDEHRSPFRKELNRSRIKRAAAETERAWQEYVNENAPHLAGHDALNGDKDMSILASGSLHESSTGN